MSQDQNNDTHNLINKNNDINLVNSSNLMNSNDATNIKLLSTQTQTSNCLIVIVMEALTQFLNSFNTPLAN